MHAIYLYAIVNKMDNAGFLKVIFQKYFFLGQLKGSYKFPHLFTSVPIFHVGGMKGRGSRTKTKMYLKLNSGSKSDYEEKCI